MKDTVLVIMAKAPHPGSSKTRLCPPLSHQQSALLCEAMLLDTLAMLSLVDWADLAVALTPPDSIHYFQSITPEGTLLLQIEGNDIGECLVKAIEHLLSMGYDKVLALNADGPSLPTGYLQMAAESLDDHDVVFGEGHDGGYYLVGLKQMHGFLFKDIPWSTSKVLSQSLHQASAEGLDAALTSPWYDIDTIQDLKRLITDLEQLPDDQLPNTRRVLAELRGMCYGGGSENC